MEGFLTDLGKTFVEKLINCVIKQSRYLFCFKCIANDFELQKKKLVPELETMRQRFTKARDKDKDITSNALFWEEQANKLIEEDTKTKQRCFFGFCPDCIWRYKRGKELANKIEEITQLIEKEERLGNIELTRRLPDIERYSSHYYIPFISRESKYQELLDALKDDSNYTIGLHGMGGTGKTTLAIEVGKQLKKLKQFDCVIFTTVSFTPDIKKIQDDIAGPLGLEWGEDNNESNRREKLWNRLTNGEKILVILDDVWGDLNFNYIGIPNIDNHKGCKLLVTTRHLWVCQNLECRVKIQLELLSEEDAWTLFERYADLDNISSKDLLKQGRQIALECKRLPVAIVIIAKSLKEQKEREVWDVALKSLQNPMSVDGVEDNLVEIYKCLKFSYDHLNDKKAKELFLICCLFQEDEEISTEILTRLGRGVGLFGKHYEKYNDARNLVVAAKKKLIDSSLLLRTNKRDVKMHDLIREVAQWIANKEILVVDFSNKNQKSSLVARDNNIKYLLFNGNPMDLCSSGFDGSKLKILILIMVTGCFVDSFFESFAGLQVLNLIAGKKMTISLPHSIQSLTNIRSLLVRGVDLGNISVLGSLKLLETLDLNRCTIDELPQQISELNKLQLLNLELCRIRSNSNPFEVIQRCPSLEELYFRNSFHNFRQEITLPALERYHLTIGFGIKLYDFSLSKCVHLKQGYLSEATFKHVIRTAQILKLERIKQGWRNLMPEIVRIDQGMNDLIELRLKHDSQLQCLLDTKHFGSPEPNVFSNLVVLELEEMENLKELCNGPIYVDSLNDLEKLSIKKCKDLGSLFKCRLNLCKLKILTLISCSTLVSVFDLSTSESLLLLESLVISDCKELENIFTNERKYGDNDNNKSCNSLFSKLKAIRITGCYNLKHIFGQHQNVELASLNDLMLIDVPNFIGIFPESNHSFEGSSHSIYKPQTQLEVEPIKSNGSFPWSHVCCYGYKLRGSSSSSTSTNIPTPMVYEDQPQRCSTSLESYCLLRLSHVMCNIKEIRLINLSKIKSVFMLSVAPKMLLLENLTILNCDELEHIGDGSGIGVNIIFPKLKELCIQNCKKLKYIFGHINASDLHQNLIHLPALKCLWFEYLPSLIGIDTNNYHTTFPHLEEIILFECPLVANESIGDFVYPMSKSQDSATIKDLRSLKAKNSKFQYIFYLDEINGKQKNLGLQDIWLYDQHQMTYLFVGPRNCFSLQNLESIKIIRCKKLENIFSIGVVKCLPQLIDLIIEECDELKYIIEDEDDNHVENKEISTYHMSPIRRTCFPKLRTVSVINCNNLKYVLPSSMCTELPKLWLLMIGEAAKLEKIFGGSEEKVGRFRNLNFVVFLELPNFFQGIQFQTVQHRLVHNCQKLSLNSTSTGVLATLMGTWYHKLDHDLIGCMSRLNQQLKEHFKTKEDTSGRNLNGTENQLSTSWQIVEIDSDSKKMQLVADLKQKGINLSFGDLSNSQETTQTNNQVNPSKEESEAASRHKLTSSQIKKKQEAETEHEFVENVPNLEIPPVAILPINLEELMNPQQSVAEIDTTVKPSQDNNLEASMSVKTAAGTLAAISGKKNEPNIQIDIAPKQKGIEKNVEEGTTSTYDKTITSSTHLEDGDGKISIPSFSTVNDNTKPPATKYADIGASQKTIAMEDINNLMEEDPLQALVALENLLTGQVSIASIRVLLQELKTLMDSSSDLDHLVSNQESKSKLISLLHKLNQHQGMLTSDEKDFVEKVQNFFDDNIIKHTTSQQLLKKYNQVLDSKTVLMNKLKSAKSTQARIDSETSTANAKIHELSLQIEDLENQIDGFKSVAKQRDVQKTKLKAECSELAQQSKELLSALASLEVDIREAERARNLAKEGFANLKSSFPAF